MPSMRCSGPARLAAVLTLGLCAGSLPLLAQSDSSATESVPRIASGLTIGSLRYVGGRTEDAASALVRVRLAREWFASIEPTVARATEPTAGAFPATSTTGFTDIPVALGLEHAFHGLLSPTLDLSLGASLPVGSTATGFGTGTLGTSVDVGGGFSPSDRLSLFAGAGRALSSVVAQSALGGGASGWADAGATYSPGDALAMLIGYSTDVGPADSTLGRGRSISAGLSYAVTGPFALNVEASHGLSGATPQWSVVVGVGTAFGSLEGAKQLRNAFGGGRHGLNKSGSSNASNGRGRGHA